MTTELYLVLEKDNLTKSCFAIISTHEIVNGTLLGQVILLRQTSTFCNIELAESFQLDGKIKTIVESKLTRKLGLDIIIQLQKNTKPAMFLDDKFGLRIDELLNLTIDDGLKKALIEK